MGKDGGLQPGKFRELNQNSGQLHAPKLANQGHQATNSFKLSKEAYNKLTANFNYNKAQGARIGRDNSNVSRKNQVFATGDLHLDNPRM